MLKIFEPMILPNANCVFFLNAATIDAANSGNDVPQAINVNEITDSLNPKSLANKIELLIKYSQLNIRIDKPPTIFKTLSQKGSKLLLDIILLSLFLAMI